uniref:Cation efflux protein transmembrane domain-containing protein n=1 Tax=Bionectria ochroleuca TaxID=29856 RepID=A0A0B7K5T4_BIOOC
MVGKRSLNRDDGVPYYRLNQQSGVAPDQSHRHGDLENGKHNHTPYHYSRRSLARSRLPPRIIRFQDAARTALEDLHRNQLKNALLSGIDRQGLERFRKPDHEIKQIKNKKLRAFYRDQNEKLNDWLEVDVVVMAAKWAINVNVAANILLLASKAFAAFTTGSLSLMASLVDSALDLLCTLIVWSTNRLVLWRLNALQKRFPVGRRRLEPLGILVFSVIMVISFLQILRESVSRLMPPHGDPEMLGYAAIASLVATIVLKGSIGLACRPIKTTQVQALVQDCKTDVHFNTLSLLFPLIGYYAHVWWLDPLGAGLLSLYIIYDWGHTSFENVTRLSGEAVDARTLRKLTYLAYRFCPVVEGFKSITAYHAGDGVWVEFDILLDENTKLSRSHDIAETLQYCAEGLGEVDRAFVTTDYAAIGPSGHAVDAEMNH